MLNAKPQINGNTADDFNAAAQALYDAADAAQAALAKVRTDVIHGRNRQHVTGWQQNAARRGDEWHITHAMEAVQRLRSLADTVATAAKGGE